MLEKDSIINSISTQLQYNMAHLEQSKTEEIEKQQRDTKKPSKFAIRRLRYEIVTPQLTQELREFKAVIKEELESSRQTREKLIEHLRELIHQTYKECTFELYGSFATGLCLPTSDIDLMLTGGIDAQFHPNEVLAVVESMLQKDKHIVEKCELIKSQSMPVLKVMFNSEYKQLNVDITVKDGKHKGIECVSLVKECISTYPQMESVLLALKHMMCIANLNNPYTGGIGSYALILMLVDCIQHFYQQVEGIEDGDLLLSFLYTYGSADFPFRIDPQRPNSKNAPILDYIDAFDKDVPFINDPLTTHNNVSKSSYLFNRALELFRFAYRQAFIESGCDCHKKTTGVSYGGCKCNSVLQRIFSSFVTDPTSATY